MAYRLDPAQPIGLEIAGVVRAQLAEASAEAIRRSHPARERIHFARTSCKKARAALALARSQAGAVYSRENVWLRDSARDLSPLRNADMLLASFQALLGRYAAEVDSRGFEPVRRALASSRRKAALSPVDRERRLDQFAARLRRAAKRLARWTLDGETFDSIAGDFCRTYRRARQALGRARATPTSTSFHEWRKATKTYSYQCRLLRRAWPPLMKAWREELALLAHLLGEEHDLTELKRRLKTLRRQAGRSKDEEAFGATLGLVATRRDELRAQAMLLGERIFADRPRVVARRMGVWWKAATRSLPTGSQASFQA